MRTLFISLALIFITNTSIINAQCIQSKSNSLFTTNQFLALTGSLDDAEEFLISRDFCLVDTSISINKKHIYYKYRLDHSLNSETDSYRFDIFYICDDTNRVEYNTSSSKNFLAYKKKLIAYGFKKSGDGNYEKSTSTKTWYMYIDRSVKNSTPNYNINVYYIIK